MATCGCDKFTPVEKRLDPKQVETIKSLREGVPNSELYTTTLTQKFIQTVFTFAMLCSSGVEIGYISSRLCYPFSGGSRGRHLLRTPMSLAIMAGTHYVVQTIIASPHYEVSSFDVFVALQKGSYRMLTMLLTHTRNVVYSTWDGHGAGMVLAKSSLDAYLSPYNRQNDFEKKVELCISLGVNFHQVLTNKGTSTLIKFVTCGVSNEILDMVSDTLSFHQLNHLDNNGKNVLYYAVQTNRLEAAIMLMDKGCIASHYSPPSLPTFSNAPFFKLITMKWTFVNEQMELLLHMMQNNVPIYLGDMSFQYKYRNRYLVTLMIESGINIVFDNEYHVCLKKETHPDIKENMEKIRDMIRTPQSLMSLSRLSLLPSMPYNKSIKNFILENRLDRLIPQPVIDYLNFDDMAIFTKYIVANSHLGKIDKWIEPKPPKDDYYGPTNDMYQSDDSDSDWDSD